MSLVIRMGLVLALFFGGWGSILPFLFWLWCESQLKETYGEKHTLHSNTGRIAGWTFFSFKLRRLIFATEDAQVYTIGQDPHYSTESLSHC